MMFIEIRTGFQVICDGMSLIQIFDSDLLTYLWPEPRLKKNYLRLPQNFGSISNFKTLHRDSYFVSVAQSWDPPEESHLSTHTHTQTIKKKLWWESKEVWMKVWNFGTYISMEDGKGKSEKKFQITESIRDLFYFIFFERILYWEHICICQSLSRREMWPRMVISEHNHLYI